MMRVRAHMLALFALGGCASADALERGDLAACSTTDDCALGLVCEAFRCVVMRQGVPEELQLEIAPPIGTPYMGIQQIDVRVSAEQLRASLAENPDLLGGAS